jgi:hypothetical protein
VTVRKDTRTICWMGMGTKTKVSPAPRTPSNFPRRNTTPRSYCRSTRIEPRTYLVRILIDVFQTNSSRNYVFDASSWITRIALTASGRRTKRCYVPSESEDIDLK